MTLPVDWADGDSFPASAENVVENAINSLMVCVTTSASTLALSASKAAYVFTGSSAATWTLPPIAGNAGKVLLLYNRGTASVTVVCSGSDSVYTLARMQMTSFGLPVGGYMTLLNDGTYWLPDLPIAPQWLYSGAGAGVSGNPTETNSWTDNIPTEANFAVLWANDWTFASVNPTASIGGTAMTRTKTFNYATDNDAVGRLLCFTLFDPPTGSQTVTVTDTSNASLGELGFSGIAYYSGVVSIGTPTTVTFASGGNLSQSVSQSVTSTTYAQCFGFLATGSGQSMSAYNHARRSPASFAGSDGGFPLLFGDAPGNDGTLTFSATHSDTSQSGGIILPLMSVA